MTNFAVVGLGYGDESKGATVAWLCENRDVGLVVRHNGGAQAGHNVVTEDGRHHTFAQWGSGTLAGVPTFLSRFMVVDPLALVPEAEHLQSIGVEDPWSMLTIDPEALVVTPWHRAVQRLRELAAGDCAHGTCGMGIGEAVRQSIERSESSLRWRHLTSEDLLGQARWTYNWCTNQAARMPGSTLDEAWYWSPEDFAAEVSAITQRVDGAAWGMGGARNDVVFEGAQGVLLDEWYGFHPHTTWSTCTFENADTLAAEAGMEKPYRLGVTRSYSVRHGPGPFPTEDGWQPTAEPHNSHDAWRGKVRYGPLDLVLLRYAADACGGVDGVALTHMDAPLVAPVRELMTPLGSVSRIPVNRKRDLDHQEALGRALMHSAPSLRAATAGVTYNVQAATQAPVVLESYGPTAADRKDAGVQT